MIKRQPDPARMYLNALRDDLTYGRWAESYLRRLEEDPELREPEIVQARSRMISKDDAVFTQTRLPDGSIAVSGERQLLSLLDRNPRNRMAFDYLMATYLLSKDVEAVVTYLPRVKSFGYPATPPLYEEAALLYAGKQRGSRAASAAGVSAAGCPISERTVSRFRRFVEIGTERRGFDSPEARSAVLRELGGTYFTYYLYGRQPPHE